ncbi:MAG: hypothetical protein K6E50_13600 [Lachnospiraceae bacterium]|nr:hypothetical protein [Lachnospiraceae bacterium]
MISLLSRTGSIPKEDTGELQYPPFFVDLNIDQILERITDGWGEDVRSLYLAFPATKEDEEYRRAVYGDFKKKEVLAAMTEYYTGMRERALYAERRENAYEEVQKQVWQLREICSYALAAEKLCEKLKEAQLASEGMKGFTAYLSECVNEEGYRSMREEALTLWKELSAFRVVLTYEKERFTLAESKGEGDYENFLAECFPGVKKDFQSPFLDREYYSRLEEEVVKLFRKKHKPFFRQLESFCKEHPEYIHDGIREAEQEMPYYLSYAQFEAKMQEKGMVFATPKTSPDKLSASGLYDLALALANQAKGKDVVANELYLAPEERFFVLTGPNQGGKTTYGRSLGQLVYFSKMGLDVPAESALVPHYSNLWTHFSVEESAETGRGKLMDELVRLKPIMEEEEEGAFVVINELFTTAANFDAIEMGKRVLEFLIGKNCRGIYVTHLGELASSCEGVVSLRAEVDENNVQTYRIDRNEAVEPGGTNSQVLKYRLTYEQLKERFS